MAFVDWNKIRYVDGETYVQVDKSEERGSFRNTVDFNITTVFYSVMASVQKYVKHFATDVLHDVIRLLEIADEQDSSAVYRTTMEMPEKAVYYMLTRECGVNGGTLIQKSDYESRQKFIITFECTNEGHWSSEDMFVVRTYKRLYDVIEDMQDLYRDAIKEAKKGVTD